MEEHRINLHIAVVLVLALGLSACASVGPVESPQFESLVQQSLPNGSEKILYANSATWLKGAYGFRKSKRAELDDYEVGVLVLTYKNLYFLIWDDVKNTYVPVFRKIYTDIRSVTEETYGMGQRIIVQDKDLETDSFEASRPGGVTTDSEKTTEAYRILQAHIPKGS